MFKVSFNSLIKILSWISGLKLRELLARIEVGKYNTDLLLLSLWVSQIILWYYDIIIKMILRIRTLISLFLARLRFPSSKSIPKIVKGCYGESVLKLVRKFERTDLSCWKAELDLSFLKQCFENSLTSKFLHFKISNGSLKLSDAYKQFQIRLLKEEILTRSPLVDKSNQNWL